MKSIIIIPSLNPNNKLIELIKELINNNIKDIIVIDDGSSNKYQNIFMQIEKLNIKVLHHDRNYGKGKAIRTGILYINENYEDYLGYITADSDGQHLVSDILKIQKEMVNHKKSLILGVRNFKQKGIPFKSKYGNKISTIYFKLKTGILIKDTQTGLRGIPKSLTNIALSTKGDRFEYEMNFLKNIAKNKIPIECIDINTIYMNKNKESHFKMRDSYLIYKDLINKIILIFIILLLFIIYINIMFIY